MSHPGVRAYALFLIILIVSMIVGVLSAERGGKLPDSALIETTFHEVEPISITQLSPPPLRTLHDTANDFRAIAENALDAPPAKLYEFLDVAVANFEKSRNALSGEMVSTIEFLAAEVRSRIASGNMPDAALQAAEAYRVVIDASDQSRTSKSVSMLDYAGLRIAADLKCKPIRWDDISDAVSFSDQHWQVAKAGIAKTDVTERLELIFKTIRQAAITRNADLTDTAVFHADHLIDALKGVLPQE